MRYLAIGVVLVFLAGCGGGDGNGAGEPMFNVSGTWHAEDAACTLVSAPQALLDQYAALLPQIERQFETYVEELPGLQIEQDGNDLTLTNLATGHAYEGTIEGDMIRYAYDLVPGELTLGDLPPFGYRGQSEVEGTVLSTDRGMAIEMLDLMVTAFEGAVNAPVEIDCDYDARKDEGA